MYTDFYGLTGRPFQLTPDPRFYVDTATHRKAMAYLSYGLAQGEGFIIITGDIGTGKTTLVGRLMETIDKSQLVAARIVSTQIGADDMLRLVAAAFNVSAEGLDKATLLNRLERTLRAHHRDGRRALLIVDEAQNLPVSSLEELRMLSNFQDGTQALLQTFLLGQPEFRDKLAMADDLEQLRQRVIATHHLEPIARDELPGYVERRMTLCSWKGDPSFTPEAYDAMYDYSGGVPRRLNTLASRILLFGALEERHDIDEDVVNEVIDDLRRDQTPSEGGRRPIRFGDSMGSVATSAPLAVAGASVDTALLRRIEALERQARQHDEALRRMLRLLSDWVGEPRDQQTAEH
jgi:putative secretion ATPase (PEP-CTERM system associated)